MSKNPQLELARSFVEETNTNIYLTGKAGTGKTTFLKTIRKQIAKRMAVVAPTGVAAINADGVTIHSLFQLSFGPNIPGTKAKDSKQRKFSKKKIDLLKSLDLLIIDEISMVRSDTLDAIDAVLKRYRGIPRPFGGVQLLMIGDLHQLPPVISRDEWSLLSQHYKTPYFFGSHALQESRVVNIELKHIYRQESKDFIGLLNKVRDNQMDDETLTLLNSRYEEIGDEDAKEGYITLTSHNNKADAINRKKLDALEGKKFEFSAVVEGDFPEHSFPAEQELELKEGAQVMFVKNDPSQDKRFFNGKIGTITKLGKDKIEVTCEGEDKIEVEPLVWENRKFELNKRTKEVEEKVIGTFEQIPLKLAWAITIHKSQGLTFDKVIIDAASAFAHGQVYVALSRCRTFEGIILRSKISRSAVQTDAVVQGYSKEVTENVPSESELEHQKKLYQIEQIRDMFKFEGLKRRLQILEREVAMNERSFVGEPSKPLGTIVKQANDHLFVIGLRFLRELEGRFEESQIPESDPEIIQRLKKAGIYFRSEIAKISDQLDELDLITDNTEKDRSVKEKLRDVEKEIHTGLMLSAVCENGFSSTKMSRVRADVDIDFSSSAKRERATEKKGKKVKVPKDLEHQEVFSILTEWRRETCQAAGLPAFRILSSEAIIGIAKALPSSEKELTRVKGIGKVKAEQFGEELIEMVDQYCEENGIEDRDMFDGPPPKPKSKKPKKDTALISFEMFKKGMTIDQIAKERDYVTSTIMNHLATYVKKGELEPEDLIGSGKVKKIRDYYRKNSPESVKDAKMALGDGIDYGEIRVVLAGMGQD